MSRRDFLRMILGLVGVLAWRLFGIGIGGQAARPETVERAGAGWLEIPMRIAEQKVVTSVFLPVMYR